MSAESAVRAVLAGVLDVLNVAAYTALSTGGVSNGVPLLGQSLPYTEVTALERRFDTFGRNGKEVDVDLHWYSDHQGEDEIFQMQTKAVQLLDDERGQAVKVAAEGYTVLQVLYEGDVRMADETVAGVQVRHRAGRFRIRVEVAA